MTSIRARAIVWYLAIFVVVFGIGLITIRQVLLIRLGNQIDEDLQHEVDELRLAESTLDIRLPSASDRNSLRLFEDFVAERIPLDGEVLIGIEDGQMIAASPLSTAELIASTTDIELWSRTDGPTSGTITRSGVEYRWLAADFGRHGTFVVAADMTTEREEISQALFVMIIVSTGGLAVGTVIAWATMGRMLAPLRRTSEAAQDISANKLATRVPVTSRDEVGQLGVTINNMLDRLDTAFSAQRDFIDDLGHELRTPLTIIRGHLDVFPTDPADQDATIAVCQDELARMGRDVEGLVVLAKARQPTFLALRSINLIVLVDEALQRARDVDPGRRLMTGQLAEGSLMCDPDRVIQALANLTTNAFQHSPPGGTVTVSSHLEDEAVRFVVADEGEGVDPADQAAIFERFARGGSAATRREGVGLGLAIVRAIAEAHHGSVGVESRDEGGASFWFTVAHRTDGAVDATLELPTARIDRGSERV